MNHSEQVNEIAAALAKAQGEMEHAKLDGVNPHFKSKYGTLQSVVSAVKPALAKNGIAYVQHSNECESGVDVETIFYHSSGQWISAGSVFIPVDRKNAHGTGSAYTYAKRYGLAMACGIGADEDDDGNNAVKSPPRQAQSVAKTVIEESNIKVDEDLASDYTSGIIAALHSEDEHGLFEILDEMDNDMKTVVWDRLDSKARTHIRKLTDARKAA